MVGKGTMVRLVRRMVRGCAPVLALLALVGGARPARAQGAAAQELYDRAAALLDDKKYTEACPMLEEVARLVPDGLGAKVTLAECYEGLGKLASAWSQYAMVEAAAGRLGQAERQRKAGEKAAALKPKLATLTLKVPDALKQLSGLTVKQDGLTVGSVLWGQAQPVDVGEHVVVVSASGMRPFEKKVEVESDGQKLDVELPEALQPEPSAVAAATSGGADAHTWQLPVAIAATSVGVAALAVGSGLGGLAMARQDESNEPGNCDSNDRCTPAGLDLRKSAITVADAATGLLVVGGVLGAAGAVLFFTLPGDAEADPAVPKPERSITLGPAYLTMQGTF